MSINSLKLAMSGFVNDTSFSPLYGVVFVTVGPSLPGGLALHGHERSFPRLLLGAAYAELLSPASPACSFEPQAVLSLCAQGDRMPSAER